MKRILLFFAAFFLLAGCKKVKENIAEEAATNFLDGTEWKIVAFTEGANILDDAFRPYYFRFNKDNTVNAVRNNATEATGTWEADISSRTIESQFGADAAHPLPFLNTTWNITKSTLTTLSATATVSGTVRTLRMEKL